MSKALVAMSGGVDSAAAALIMLEAGYEVCGVTLILNGNYDDADGARKTAEKLGIDHYTLEAEDTFKNAVIDDFVDGYRSGLTPNPCIECNRNIKFGVLYEEMKNKSFDVLATGHYARIDWDDCAMEPRLCKASDYSKDQSYVLYSVAGEKFKNIVFPLGNKTKTEIREIAKNAGFECFVKGESQDICFIKDGDYAAFILDKCPECAVAGDFCDRSGRKLGRHKGLISYTVGQRRGLGVPSTESYYVLEKNTANNTVVLGYKNELYTRTFSVKDVNILCPSMWSEDKKYTVRTRYHQKETECGVLFDNNTVKVTTDTDIRIPAPGQSAVFYDGDVVVAGGIID